MRSSQITFTSILLYLILGSVLGMNAQSIVWQKTYGGSKDDRLKKIKLSSDGGYIICGTSFSGGNGSKTTGNFDQFLFSPDIWVIKTDILGNIQWQYSYGGDYWDEFADVKQTKDKGYIIGGWSASGINGNKTEAQIGAYDYWVIKLDSIGNIEWQNVIGSYGYDVLSSVLPTDDGGYLIGGSSDSQIGVDKAANCYGNTIDYWILKLNSIGQIVWQKTIGGYGSDFLYSMCTTSDHGYLLAGWSDSPIGADKTIASFGNADYWLVKIDSLGNILWQKVFGGNKYDEGNMVSISQRNEILISGYSNSDSTGNKISHNRDSTLATSDYWVLLLDSIGNILWQQPFGGNSNENTFTSKCISNDQFLIGGGSQSGISGDKTDTDRGNGDYWYVITDHNGNIQNQQTIGGNNGDFLYDMDTSSTGQLILGGMSFSNISGEKTSNSYSNSIDYWILLLERPTVGIVEHNNSKIQINVFPNPANEYLKIENININSFNKCLIEIEDVLGRVIRTENIDSNIIDIATLKSGYYLLNIYFSKQRYIAKFIKL